MSTSYGVITLKDGRTIDIEGSQMGESLMLTLRDSTGAVDYLRLDKSNAERLYNLIPIAYEHAWDESLL